MTSYLSNYISNTSLNNLLVVDQLTSFYNILKNIIVNKFEIILDLLVAYCKCF